jgi:RNA polymerase sigma-70 factor, ECF subfamily
MNALTEAERYLLDAVRRGDEQGWPQLVDRYQGRLLAFARQRVRNASDAEDLVQETFIGLLRGLERFRGDSSLETYLFSILRRRVMDAHRGKARSVCLLGDTLRVNEEDSGPGPEARLPAPDPTASTYARRDEHRGELHRALAGAITELVRGYKAALNFRELKMIELLFYAQLKNAEVAQAVGVGPGQVATLKHRSLARIRKLLTDHGGGTAQHNDDPTAPPDPRDTPGPTDSPDPPDALLTEVWEDHRPSCPKRSTIGGYHLGTLEPAWQDYADFHLNTLGCRFCLANLDDLKESEDRAHLDRLRQRVLQSTVGFLKKS